MKSIKAQRLNCVGSTQTGVYTYLFLAKDHCYYVIPLNWVYQRKMTILILGVFLGA